MPLLRNDSVSFLVTAFSLLSICGDFLTTPHFHVALIDRIKSQGYGAVRHKYSKHWWCVAVMMLTMSEVLADEEPTLPGIVCRMTHSIPVEGLKRVENPSLLDRSQRLAGGGGLCGAFAYQVEKPVAVYRVSAWSSDKAPSYYNWWSFENPAGSAELYRKANVMCDEWGVDMKTLCKLRVGAVIAVGFGQSYEHCHGGKSVSASPRLQIYIAGTPTDIKGQLEECSAERGLIEP